MNENWTLQRTGVWVKRKVRIVGDFGEMTIDAQVSPCGQFAVDQRDSADGDGWWAITHLASGMRVGNSAIYAPGDWSEAEIKRIVEIISPLADWNNLPDSPDERADIRARCQKALSGFPNITSTQETK